MAEAGSPPVRWRAGRWLPALVTALLAGLLASLFALGQIDLYRTIMNTLGGEALASPFMDMHAVLSALQCHRQGIDVYALNPCDAFARTHAYSPVWLYFSFIPATTEATIGLGLLLGAAFIAGLLALPPARRGRELLLMCLACTSSTVLFALERANNDLIVWLLTLTAIYFLRHGWGSRIAGYAVVVFAGLLKFYPMILLALSLWERPRRVLAICAGGIGVAGAIILLDVTSWRRALAGIPTARHSIDMFGASNFPNGLADGLARMGFDAPWIAPGLLALCVLYAASLVVRLNLLLDLPRQLACLNQHERLLLMAGAALITGCFFTAASAFYRGIHFLFVLPALFALWRQAEKDTARTCAGASIVVVVILWTEGLRQMLARLISLLDLPDEARRRADLLVWTMHELLSWWVVGLLGALLLALALRTPSGVWFVRLVAPYRPAAWRPR